MVWCCTPELCERSFREAQVAAEGVPLNVIQRQLGHANLAVTSLCLDHISAQDVVAVIRKRTWASFPAE